MCSNRAATLLKAQQCAHPVKPRGIVPIKGKGNMKVYWVADIRTQENVGAERPSRVAKAKRLNCV